MNVALVTGRMRCQSSNAVPPDLGAMNVAPTGFDAGGATNSDY
jgi:hypothetical protein